MHAMKLDIHVYTHMHAMKLDIHAYTHIHAIKLDIHAYTHMYAKQTLFPADGARYGVRDEMEAFLPVPVRTIVTNS
jgi:hypothetical protein